MPKSHIVADTIAAIDDIAVVAIERKLRILPAVDIDRVIYPLQFYRQVLPALARPHRLRSGRRIDYRTSFSVPEHRQRRWSNLFAADPGVPFTYCNTSATTVLMRILADAGVNFRHVRHASTELTLPLRPYVSNADYTLLIKADLPVAVRRDRVTITTHSGILDPSGILVANQTDCWSIGGLAERDVQGAVPASAPDRHHWRSLLVHRPLDEPDDVLAIPIAADLGKRYGRLSGDLNPTHLSTRAARLFGSPDAFVQGFCTTNLALAALWRTGRRPTRFKTCFVRPVFVDQIVDLRVRGGVVDLSDRNGTVLMVGSWV